MKTKLNAFQKTALATIFITIFLIFVGGLVRAVGAGLGCPDWPKCFGSWIPPFSASQLPPGFDKSQFNPVLMVVEYVNRLVGITTGIMIILTFIRSIKYRKTEPAVFYSSGIAMLLVGFEGWLGGQVVKSSLKAWIISVHMYTALAILLILIYATYKAFQKKIDLTLTKNNKTKLYWSGIVLLVATLIQIGFGTQVRQSVDVVKDSSLTIPRSAWLSQVGFIDTIHQTFSWVVMIACLWLIYNLRLFKPQSIYRRIGTSIFALLIFQILLGIGLVYLNMPPALEVLHLTNISILVSTEFIFLLLVQQSSEIKKPILI
ncbi:MAG TPA: COX15/CtaA family protein [Balneolales bacterium]|nr:COX15/CtaA family protein [Balneolales bacterium]